METFTDSIVNAKSLADAPANWMPANADMFKVAESGSVGGNPYGLRYYYNPDKTLDQLIVRTSGKEVNYNGTYGTPTTAGSNYTIYGNKDVLNSWVTTGQGLTSFIDSEGLTASTMIKGVERGLGMNNTSAHDAIFEMAVTVGNSANSWLLRPVRNPDPTKFGDDPTKYGTNGAFPADAAAAGIGTGAAADAVFANYKAAYEAWAISSHSDPKESNRFPWTELGYTYYRGQAQNVPTNLSEVQGMSEFILLGGAGGSDPLKTPSATNESGNVVVVGIYATQSYIYTKNDGTNLSTAADAQYGNGFASFNVTGPCNTLWAGRDFQVGANLNAAALPNKIIIGAGGSIAGGQGILVGSQHYRVENAGSITADAGARKFNVAGSENIAILFKGDTHAVPYVGTVKNTLINSGTIMAPGANGTAVAAWAGDTDITNTGTITGTGTGYAIKTGAGNDTLTVNGGEIAGKIDLGTGTDNMDVPAGSSARFTFALNTDAPAAAQIKSQTVAIADNTTTVAVRATGITNIKNNDQFLIADATTLTLDPAKLSIVNDPALPMVTFSPQTSGNQLFLTALRDAVFYGQRVGNASLGYVLDGLANTATGDMAAVLGALDSSGDPTGARQMQPTVNNGPIQASFGTVSQYTNTVMGRIGQVLAARSGATGISTGGETAQSGVWAKGFGSYLHQGVSPESSGYTANAWGVSLGYDTYLFENLIAGFSAAYARNSITTNDVNTRTDADSYQGSLYGSLARDAWYLDAVLSFAHNRYDASRHIVFAGIDRTAKSNYGGRQYSGYFEGGYTLKASGLLLTPLVSVQAMRLNLEGYTETEAGALNLKIDRQRYNLFQTGLGAKVAYPVIKKSLRITPELHAKWLYDFAGDAQQATSTFTGGGASFVTTGFEPPRSSGNIGAKLTILTQSNWSVSLNYDFEMKTDFYSHTAGSICAMSSKRVGFLFLSALLLCAAGCAALFPLNDRYAAADRLAEQAGFEKSYIRASSFTLTAFTRFTKKGDPLHVYMEGDGEAWLSRTRLSDDPTPRPPLVLELAALDPATNVAYLARPGQYGANNAPGCDAAYWSDKRFAGEVVEAMSRAVGDLRKQIGAGAIHLVGYSGGAVIAVLVAARRSDVVSLRTVAGNLDPDAVNRYHRVSPLAHSQSPMDVAANLKNLPQRHFVGSEDTVIPPGIARSFLNRAGRGDASRITVVEGATHTRGWQERWKALLVIPLN